MEPAYTLMNSHFVTMTAVAAATLLAPFYVLATYVFSGASPRKGALIGAAFLVFGALMTWTVLSDLPRSVGPLGNLIIPACWITPSLILVLGRSWFLSEPLSQRWLVGLQVWRLVGGVFLIEMARGNLPGVFAYPAGIGDIVVGLAAALALIAYRSRAQLPRAALVTVLALGITDFVVAFLFGIASSPGPQQLFFPDVTNDLRLFPTGMIPMFFVPFAIFFHTLSWLSLRRFDTSPISEHGRRKPGTTSRFVREAGAETA